jgi:hypothetical protein
MVLPCTNTGLSFYIAISPCMNTLDHREILLTCFLQSRQDAKNPWAPISTWKRQFQSLRMPCTVVLPYFLLIYILLMHFVAYKKLWFRLHKVWSWALCIFLFIMFRIIFSNFLRRHNNTIRCYDVLLFSLYL